MLGLYFININIDQAFLCFEMALFYCNDPEDVPMVQEMYNLTKRMPANSVRNLSIMILSYNDHVVFEKCIDSITETLPDSCYEVVVVDNASTDGELKKYLRELKDKDKNILVVENSENYGFPKGCNIGVTCCNRNNDVLFLNNDTVLMPNAVFWLRMGLYDNRNVGATGALSNQAPLQDVDIAVFSAVAGKNLEKNWHKRFGIEESVTLFKSVAVKYGVPIRNPYKKVFRLTGFALLLGRTAIEMIAPDLKVFDERYTPGYFEDDDLGIRLASAGFEQYVCMNSFIYHDGGDGFIGHNDALEKSRLKFADKWGVDITSYYDTWDDAVEIVRNKARTMDYPPRIIDFTCGFGINASRIKCDIEGAYVAGVCNNSFEAGIARNIVDDEIWGDLRFCKLPWQSHSFDFILAKKNSIDNYIADYLLRAEGCVIWKV